MITYASMLEKYIKTINPIITMLNGKRIEKIDGVLIPEYLFSFPNNIWLSFDLDKRDNYFDVKLGGLFYFDDVMPRIIVLESIEYYFEGINELKIGNINYNFCHQSFEINEIFDLLKKYLPKIIENYQKLINTSTTKNLILNEEERLKSYLLEDLSDSTNLELDLKDKIANFKGKINKINSNKILNKENKSKQRKNLLIDGIAEILFGFSVIAIGLLCYFLFSLVIDVSNLPFELFLFIGIIIVILFILIIWLIIHIIRKNKK